MVEMSCMLLEDEVNDINAPEDKVTMSNISINGVVVSYTLDGKKVRTLFNGNGLSYTQIIDEANEKHLVYNHFKCFFRAIKNHFFEET